MPKEQQVRITVAAAVLAGVAAIAASLAAWFSRPTATPSLSAQFQSDTRQHIDSPITASGGSMTFRAQSKWTCSTPTSPSNVSTVCIASTGIASFGATRLYRLDTNSNFLSAPSYGRGSGYESGAVTFYLRPASGDPGATAPTPSTTTTPYIVLCTSSFGSYDIACSGTNYIQVQVYNVATPTPTHAILVASAAVEPSTSDYASASYAIQYFDPACAVHGTASVPIPSPIPACEHPGWVTWVDKQSYLCVHGLCSVALDN